MPAVIQAETPVTILSYSCSKLFNMILEESDRLDLPHTAGFALKLVTTVENLDLQYRVSNSS